MQALWYVPENWEHRFFRFWQSLWQQLHPADYQKQRIWLCIFRQQYDKKCCKANGLYSEFRCKTGSFWRKAL